MLEELSGMIVDRLLRKEVIQYDDIEIYMYGIIHLLTYVIHVIPMMVISIVLGECWQGALFAVAFAFLRTYAGGYHTSTSERCFYLSMGVFTAALLVMKYLTVSDFICWGTLALSGVGILCLSPVEAVNKPLDHMERRLYRKKSIVIWFVEALAAVAFMMAGMKDVAVCIILVHVVVSCSLIAGVLKEGNIYTVS